MIIGWKYPDSFEHWNSSKFWLSPDNPHFYSVFFFVLFIGVYSLTVILYRAHNISTVDRKQNLAKKRQEVFLDKEEDDEKEEEEEMKNI